MFHFRKQILFFYYKYVPNIQVTQNYTKKIDFSDIQISLSHIFIWQTLIVGVH